MDEQRVREIVREELVKARLQGLDSHEPSQAFLDALEDMKERMVQRHRDSNSQK